ncbi:LamG-like jellyroll fold domain-containing protein [Micromonospora sp. CPCC 206060]|uniref:LamG-like jellyroll fold domain-containing protein n=1 Tax=Micromonospora sp. CPCC 206060 TaxID=3122406 RepID=UPI002FEEB789
MLHRVRTLLAPRTGRLAGAPPPRGTPSRLLASLTMSAVVAAAGTVAMLGAVSAPAAAAATPTCEPVKQSEADALTTAAACDQPVVVGASRSEYVQVVAQPDGRLTFQSAVVPQRTRKPDNSWADINLALQTGGDGRLRPVASVADVSFSGGGAGPMVTLQRSGRSLQLTWPGTLPAPTLSGDAATYPSVLPDVDLVVRATHTGFTHVLVVKTPTAADNPAVRTISFGVDGDASLLRRTDGSLQARAGTTVVAEAQPALMWDSSVPVGGGGTEAARSSAFEPGDGVQTAKVETRVAGDGDLELVPDATMLDAPSVTYPVYVDPSWSVQKSKWAYATNTNCSNSDFTVARVGLSPEGPCDGDLFRSFFEFPTTGPSGSLAGKHIESAYVQMKLDHSWSCTDTPVSMYLTSVIDHTMKASWNGMNLKTRLATAEGHANEGTGCVDSPQPDMFINWTGAPVTTQVQTAATNNWTTITVGFTAHDSTGSGESTTSRWKKFFPANAAMVVDYDSKPGKPTGLQVSGVACVSGTSIAVGTETPVFSAIYPDADTGQTLTGTYEWIEVPTVGGMSAVTTTYPTRRTAPPTAPASANGRATTAQVSAPTGKKYAFRVTTVDPSPYNQWSGWSIWCEFRVDTSVPPAPAINVGPVAGPGEPITFTFTSSGDAAADVTKFRYSWTGPPTVLQDAWTYAGDGVGDFSDTPDSPASNWETDGAVFSPGDLSGDGKPDVIFRRTGDASLYIVKGNGTGGFLGAPELLDAGNWSASRFLFSPGDFSGDGKPDIIYRDRVTSHLYLRRGTAGGGLEASSVQIGTNWYAFDWFFSPGDLSGDGKADVLVREASGALGMYRGNGTGGWITGTKEPIGTGFAGSAIFGRGDFSGDGKTDVLYRSDSTGDVKLLRGNGTGGWLDGSGVSKGTIPIGGAIFVPGDFTGDGKADIFATVSQPPNFGELTATGTTTKTATVTLTPYSYGTNTIRVRAIDSAGLESVDGSEDVTVQEHAKPVAQWDLESYPGETQAQALEDDRAGFGDSDGAGPIVNDTPLTASNVTWANDTYLMQGSTPTLNGTSAALTTQGPVVDTTGAFSVAAWVRLAADPTADMTIATQQGSDAAGFELGVRRQGSPLKSYWSFGMRDTQAQSSTLRSATASQAIVDATQVGRWVHLAGVYDKLSGQIRLFVDGVLAGETARTAAGWQASGAFSVGRGFAGGAPANWWGGTVRDVQVFNRVLVADDFTGRLATRTDEVDDRGILAPTQVGWWDFNTARNCRIQDLVDTCQARDNTLFDRWLALQRGAEVTDGRVGNSLHLDALSIVNEGETPVATQEYARSALQSGTTFIDDNEYTVWQNTPVLRTDQSFTVSAWVQLDRTDQVQTVLSQDGTVNSGFYLYYTPDNGGEWKFKIRPNSSATTDTDATVLSAAATDVGESWNHIAAVVDVARRQVHLYVDGEQVATSALNAAWQPWQASGPLTVGRETFTAGGNHLFGRVDDLTVLQGAMTAVEVKTRYHADVSGTP